MLMVVSVSIDRVARENNALNRILNEHGIASVEDLALSPEQLDALLSTGMAGSVSQNGAGVYFLKGYAKSLSMLWMTFVLSTRISRSSGLISPWMIPRKH